MAVRSREFVGIAEGIKSHELSTKGKIESLKGVIFELSGRKSSLDSRISYLEAALSAAYEDTDEDGNPNYGRIAALEGQIGVAERELSAVETQLDSTQGELRQSESELEAVMEEKAQTLFEIQERARKTSQHISAAGGMYGAFSGAGGALQGSLQTSLSSLSHAASILDGNVAGAVGGGSSVGGSLGVRGGAHSSDLSTGALSAFSGGINQSTATLSKGSTGTSSSSDYATKHNGSVTPATIHSFRSGGKTNNLQKAKNFDSVQSENSYATQAFSKNLTSDYSTPSKYESIQQSVQSGKRVNPFTAWMQRNKSGDTIEFSGLTVVKNTLLGGRYFVKGNNYDSFCDYRKNVDQYTHICCNESKTIDARDIEGIYLNDTEVQNKKLFWNRGIRYEIDSESFFEEVASHIPEINVRLQNGDAVDSITSNPKLKTCYELYFQKPIEVYEVDGFYEFAGSGRHRCMAAQKLGLAIPVKIVARYEPKESITSSPPRDVFSDSKQYGYIVDKLSMANVKYRPIKKYSASRSSQEIVGRLGGGDLTGGSCSSLALAYAGNIAGYDVLDFRDGESREFFSSRKTIQEIATLPNVISSIDYGKNDIESAKALLRKAVLGKEYYLAIGQHAAIVRRNVDRFEYLELQHPSSGNGWHTLDANILIARFKCRKERLQEISNYLIDIDSLSNNKEFLHVLGFINTASVEQRKGCRGNVK